MLFAICIICINYTIIQLYNKCVKKHKTKFRLVYTNNLYNKSNMGFFNFIETFFFISLGITFVLILLLVYHFKQRICTLEQKGTTMFEIVNGVVKELTNIKRMVIQNSMGGISMVESNPYSKTNPAILLKPEDLYTNTEPTYTENAMSEYDESSDEDEYIDSDEEDTYVEEEWIEDKREPTNVDTTENIKIINYNADTLESVETMDAPESDVSSEDDIPNEPELIVSEDVEIPIVIKLDEEEEEEEKEEKEEEEEEEKKEEEEEEEKEEEPIEEVVTDEIEQTPVPSIKEKEESYKRLNVNQLKAIVVSKGITTDTSKLKKNDLIKLLENFE